MSTESPQLSLSPTPSLEVAPSSRSWAKRLWAYYHQLTVGCGSPSCRQPFCATARRRRLEHRSSAASPSDSAVFPPALAQVLATQLATRWNSRLLCEPSQAASPVTPSSPVPGGIRESRRRRRQQRQQQQQERRRQESSQSRANAVEPDWAQVLAATAALKRPRAIRWAYSLWQWIRPAANLEQFLSVLISSSYPKELTASLHPPWEGHREADSDSAEPCPSLSFGTALLQTEAIGLVFGTMAPQINHPLFHTQFPPLPPTMGGPAAWRHPEAGLGGAAALALMLETNQLGTKGPYLTLLTPQVLALLLRDIGSDDSSAGSESNTDSSIRSPSPDDDMILAHALLLDSSDHPAALLDPHEPSVELRSFLLPSAAGGLFGDEESPSEADASMESSRASSPSPSRSSSMAAAVPGCGPAELLSDLLSQITGDPPALEGGLDNPPTPGSPVLTTLRELNEAVPNLASPDGSRIAVSHPATTLILSRLEARRVEPEGEGQVAVTRLDSGSGVALSVDHMGTLLPNSHHFGNSAVGHASPFIYPTASELLVSP
ncbi:hypothetical protein BJ085DRAFT_37469, partial [Dimargaris cristalligena]